MSNGKMEEEDGRKTVDELPCLQESSYDPMPTEIVGLTEL